MNNNTVSLVTSKKEDIFDIAETLAGGIDASFMSDAAQPVIVTVRGSIMSGKKIFPDAVRKKLLGDTALCHFNGKKEYDEFWSRMVDGRMLEVDFINLAWKCGFETPDIHRQCVYNADLMPAFNKVRKHGGVSFIHNLHGQARANASIDIWLERKWGVAVSCEPPKAPASSLSAVFDRVNHLDESTHGVIKWTRYVEIAVLDPVLRQSPKMREALSVLSKSAQAVAKAATSSAFIWELPERPYRQPQPGGRR